MFIRDLLWNLFGEGNDVFREGDWTKSIEMYTEALSVAEYADSEEIYVPTNLLEKLYANRAAAYLNIVPVSRREWSRLLSRCAKCAAVKIDFRASDLLSCLCRIYQKQGGVCPSDRSRDRKKKVNSFVCLTLCVFWWSLMPILHHMTLPPRPISHCLLRAAPGQFGEMMLSGKHSVFSGSV